MFGIQGFDYQGFVMRPPSEAYSILIQFTLGCSHNKCTFCNAYKDKRFAIKPQETLERDFAFAERHCRHQDRLFLMDGDALVAPQARWEWVLEQIRTRLPWVRRVGTYANAKSVRLKSDEELRRLREMGLGIAYYGVESGDDVTLDWMNKGADAEELIKQALRLKAAGIKLSITVLLGIAGQERSMEHARATGRLLSAIDPEYVGALTVMVMPETPLQAELDAGTFRLPTPQEALAELREMVAHTDLSNGLFMSNHASNYLPVKIQYPHDKEPALRELDKAVKGASHLRSEWMRRL